MCNEEMCMVSQISNKKEDLHLEGRGIGPKRKSPVSRFLSMFGSNCIPSTLINIQKCGFVDVFRHAFSGSTCQGSEAV